MSLATFDPVKKPEAAKPARDRAPPEAAEVALPRNVAFVLALPVVVIVSGRKVSGFCALLALGWLYFRILALRRSLFAAYPGAGNSDPRQTPWTALLLIMAQG